LTFICEIKTCKDFVEEMKARPARDVERAAWFSRDMFSGLFLTAIPSKSQRVANREWLEMVATYYGLGSPACAPYDGQSVMLDGRRLGPLDKYGEILMANRRLSNRDGARTVVHNAIENAMANTMREADLDFRMEPSDMFSSVLPQAGRQRFERDRENRGAMDIRPDFVIKIDGHEKLFDVKTIVWCFSKYRSSFIRGSGPAAQAAQARADAVHPDYCRHGAKFDETYAGVPRGANGRTPYDAPGPVLQKLLSFGVVQGLVVGAFSEASDAVYDLARRCAKGLAVKHWHEMLARNKEDAEAALLGRVRREWAITTGREMARLKVDQLDKYVRGSTGRGAAAATRRAQREYYQWRQTAYTEHVGYGRGFFGVPDRRA
jgi:hypothetical protein